MEINAEWLNEALRAIRCGIFDKLTLGNITVYRVKSVIRIDKSIIRIDIEED